MAEQSTFIADTEPFMESLYAAALRLTNNRSDAEDLLQETYLRAFRGYGSFRTGTNLRAWLFRILTNAHINRYRTKKRRPEETDLDDVEELFLFRRLNGEGTWESAEQAFLSSITEGEILTAVSRLPEAYRLAVILADVEGFSYKEIAAILDIPVGTVMSRLHRGRKSLQKALYTFAAKRGLV